VSKHTKGPWIAVENDGAYVKNPEFATWRIEERGSAAEMVVAVIISDIALLADKVEANARLMAAAPEMRAALNKAYDLIRAEYSCPKAAALEGHPIDKVARPTWDAICDVLGKIEAAS